MVLLVAIFAGFGLGLLLGGHPQYLLRLRPRWAALIFAALVLHLAIFTDVLGVPLSLVPGLYLLSNVLAAGWLLRNIAIAGFPCIMVGALSNLLAIAANGGRMPVDRRLLAEASGSAFVQAVGSGQVRIKAVLADAHTNLPWLTDRFLLPRPFPLPTVFSVGDILIGLGVIWLVAAAMRAPASAGRPRSAAERAA